MKFLTRSFAVAALLLGAASTSHAQTWFTVTTESQATTVTLPAGTTYRFGNAADNLWSVAVTVAADTSFNPVYWPAGVFPFADPDPGQVKELDVLETSAAQVVTLNGTPFPIAVLPPVLAVCALPAALVVNPAIPVRATACALGPNATPVAVDGAVVLIKTVAAAVYLQYCVGSVCNPAVMFGAADPLTVGPSALLGGPVTGSVGAAGSLYILEGARPVTLTVGGVAQTVPAGN